MCLYKEQATAATSSPPLTQLDHFGGNKPEGKAQDQSQNNAKPGEENWCREQASICLAAEQLIGMLLKAKQRCFLKIKLFYLV